MAKFEEFRCWLRAQLHRLAVAIRDSVLWPVCVLVVDCAREISLLIYRTTIKPVLDYFYQRYKIIETAVLIYILGPICKVFINNIPEKNPFCGWFISKQLDKQFQMRAMWNWKECCQMK